MITDYHAAYYAWELTRRHSSVFSPSIPWSGRSVFSSVRSGTAERSWKQIPARSSSISREKPEQKRCLRPTAATLRDRLTAEQEAIVGAITAKNSAYFESEMEKLEAWADDLKTGEKRRHLFDAQDAIDVRKGTLQGAVEVRPRQQVELKPLFTVRWSVK